MNKVSLCSALLITTMLAGCGGGGGSSGSSSSLTGTAATGAPLADASIIVKDASGTEATATADADGKYSVSVSGLTAPLIISATGLSASGGVTTLYSAVDEIVPGTPPVANVTPMTNAVISQTAGGDPSNLFNNFASENKQTFLAAKSAAKENITAAIVALVGNSGDLPAGFDPFKTKFDADKSGVDKVLELFPVSVGAGGAVEITLPDGDPFRIAPGDSASAITSAAVAKNTAVASLIAAPIKQLDTLKAAWNSATASQSALAGTSFADLFDGSFLDSGRSRDQFLESIRSVALNSKMLKIQCAPGTIRSVSTEWFCDGQAQIAFHPTLETFPNPLELSVSSKTFEVIETPTIPLKFLNNQWRFVGNQSEIDYEIRPYLTVALDPTTFAVMDDSVAYSLNVAVPTTVCPDLFQRGRVCENPIYSLGSATIEWTADGGESFSPVTFMVSDESDELSFVNSGALLPIRFLSEDANSPDVVFLSDANLSAKGFGLRITAAAGLSSLSSNLARPYIPLLDDSGLVSVSAMEAAAVVAKNSVTSANIGSIALVRLSKYFQEGRLYLGGTLPNPTDDFFPSVIELDRGILSFLKAYGDSVDASNSIVTFNSDGSINFNLSRYCDVFYTPLNPDTACSVSSVDEQLLIPELKNLTVRVTYGNT